MILFLLLNLNILFFLFMNLLIQIFDYHPKIYFLINRFHFICTIFNYTIFKAIPKLILLLHKLHLLTI